MPLHFLDYVASMAADQPKPVHNIHSNDPLKVNDFIESAVLSVNIQFLDTKLTTLAANMREVGITTQRDEMALNEIDH